MKRLEKIELIDIIARELQKRMKFFEINGYFETYGRLLFNIAMIAD